MEAKKSAQPKSFSTPRGALERRLARGVYAGIVASSILAPALALAAATDITISTAAAPATPRINGPRIIGSIPGSPFLYTVPATGQAPLKFEASGLPDGLAIDAASGTISGKTPSANSYSITLTVSNGSGTATTTLTLKAGPTLALTPPMGWNSYDSFGADVKESDMKAAADAMKTLMQPYGWNTAVIDYRWYDPEQVVDANGRWLPSTSKYPSATGSTGFKSLAEYVHSKGLSFGIHLMRGIPRTSVQKNTPILNSTATASQAGNTGDTCSWDSHMYGVKDTDAGKAWYDSIYQQYADWGVDFAKVDDMMNPYGGNVLHSAEVVAVHNSIVKTGRSIILSLSPGPNQTKDVAVLNENSNMWRQVNDFWDNSGSLSSMSNEFDAANAWANTSGITPGHWPDADMLPLGTIGNRACAFSHNQQVMVMTLWTIMPSPLMFGGMPTKLANDSWTLALLTNDEVLAVNQDALGARGKRLSQQNNIEVWSKDLSDGRKAVALFNRATQDATVSVTFTQLGVTGTPAVRDLWNKKDVTGMTTGISVNVPHESALLYAVGTASTGGTGGTTGAGGSGGGGVSGAGGGAGNSGSVDGGSDARGSGGSASGGSSGSGNGGAVGTSGGATGAGGAVVSGGSSGRGGSSGGSGGVVSAGGSSAASGGTVSSGGTTAKGAGGQSAGGSSGQAQTSNSGCSCALGTRNDRSSMSLFLMMAAAAVLVRSARRRRR